MVPINLLRTILITLKCTLGMNLNIVVLANKLVLQTTFPLFGNLMAKTTAKRSTNKLMANYCIYSHTLLMISIIETVEMQRIRIKN